MIYFSYYSCRKGINEVKKRISVFYSLVCTSVSYPGCQRGQTRKVSLAARVSTQKFPPRFACSEVLASREESVPRERKRGCPPESHVRDNVRWKTMVGHGTVTCTVKEHATTSAFAGRESVARTRFASVSPVPCPSLYIFYIYALLRSLARY